MKIYTTHGRSHGKQEKLNYRETGFKVDVYISVGINRTHSGHSKTLEIIVGVFFAAQ